MTLNRPITMSLPFGLFSAATLTSPLPKISERSPVDLPLARELLDMPNVVPDVSGLDEDIYWDDGA